MVGVRSCEFKVRSYYEQSEPCNSQLSGMGRSYHITISLVSPYFQEESSQRLLSMNQLFLWLLICILLQG
jgi:hypothetical protein